MPIRYISLVLVAVIIGCRFIFDIPSEYMNLSLALTVLFGQIVELIIFRRNLKGHILFKVSSNEWINGWIMVGFLMYWFSSQDMNGWNILAISALIIYGILGSIQNYKTHYTLTKKGILNLTTNKFIKIEDITDIEVKEAKVSVNTANYKNELIIHSSKLIYPQWNELISKLSVIKKKEG